MSAQVFYSWQSERPPHVSRDFIRSTLVQVLETTLRQGDLMVCDAERDGMDDLRIAHSRACVIDLTSVPTDTEQVAPNPEGLIDLERAIQSLGRERVVCLVNTSLGFSQLGWCRPDVFGHVILFSLEEDDRLAVRLEVRRRIVGALANALRPVVGCSAIDPANLFYVKQ